MTSVWEQYFIGISEPTDKYVPGLPYTKQKPILSKVVISKKLCKKNTVPS